MARKYIRINFNFTFLCLCLFMHGFLEVLVWIFFWLRGSGTRPRLFLDFLFDFLEHFWTFWIIFWIFSRIEVNPVLIVGWCRWDIGIFQKSSQRRGTRGCRNLGLRDLDSRNERIRIIAFQNIQKFSNRSSINIFLCRRKLIEKPKKSESDLRRMSVYRRFNLDSHSKAF